jgi:hypothetical protein
MAVDELSVYEVWDLEQPKVPPRSRLYHLEPAGVGTAEVESLTGYVARLAEAHCVQTRMLVVHEIVPLLGRAHLSKPVNSSLSAFWSKDARSLNGTRRLARDWVQALETLTLHSDLRFLTLLTWADVLTPKGLLRATRAWCPACYEAWRAAGQVVYDPLLWSLQVVTICPRHRRRLSLRCPHPECRQPQPVLASRSRPGYCSRCGRWLGVASGKGKADGEALEEKDIEWQLWVARVIGELLAVAPGLPGPPQREKMLSALSACVARAAQGGVRALARGLDVSRDVVYSWRLGRQIPILELLLRLCAHTATSPLDLLAAVKGTVPPYEGRLPVRSTSAPRPPVRRRPFDADAVRRALEAVLAGDEHPPPPMRQIAERIGYAHSALHRHFPDLCRAISAQYLAYRKACGLQRQQRLCREIHQVAASIHAQGIYPSAYRIEQQLSVPGFIRHPEGMAAWRAALQELGWAS